MEKKSAFFNGCCFSDIETLQGRIIAIRMMKVVDYGEAVKGNVFCSIKSRLLDIIFTGIQHFSATCRSKNSCKFVHVCVLSTFVYSKACPLLPSPVT